MIQWTCHFVTCSEKLFWGRKMVRIKWKVLLLFSPIKSPLPFCLCCVSLFECSAESTIVFSPDGVCTHALPTVLFSSGDLFQWAGTFDPSRWDHSCPDLPSWSHQCPVQILGWPDCCWCPVSAVPLWGRNCSEGAWRATQVLMACGCCCSSDPFLWFLAVRKKFQELQIQFFKSKASSCWRSGIFF